MEKNVLKMNKFLKEVGYIHGRRAVKTAFPYSYGKL